jgi:hypothetical protein
MTERTSAKSLDLRLRTRGVSVTLADVRRLAGRCHRALADLASHLAVGDDAAMRFDVTKANVGSLSLEVHAVAEAPDSPDPDAVLSTFTSDMAGISQGRFRPGLTAALLSTYERLAKDFTNANEILEIRCGDQAVTVNAEYEVGLAAALKEKIATGIELTGYLDAVIAHRPPFAFYLYPKLEPNHRIDCRFPPALRSSVAELLKDRSLVRVVGTASFGPIGIYPIRMDIEDRPERIDWNPAALIALLGALPIVPKGESAEIFLAARRKESGLGA